MGIEQSRGPAEQIEKKRKSYAELSREMPPSADVIKAVDFVQEKNMALDFGAGSLRNSRYLLDQGFKVTAVDRDPLMLKIATELTNPKLETHVTNFLDFNFPKDEYDLIVAKNTLPFEIPERFPELWERLKSSLKPNGIFVGSFFGPHDTWATTHPDMTFLSREEVEGLLKDFETLKIKEWQEDETDIQGNLKHWHVTDTIARLTK